MTPKQDQFVREYLVDLNATQAAIRAGYSAKTANSQGARLLANVSVSRAIAEAKTTRAEKCEIDAEWVLSRLMTVAERCLQAEPVMIFDPVEKAMVAATDDEGRAVYTFDSKGANGALKLLGDHLGLYVKKVEHSGPNGSSLNLNLTVDRPPIESRDEWLERRARELAAPLNGGA